jgi:DUF177 domain-containing protein
LDEIFEPADGGSAQIQSRPFKLMLSVNLRHLEAHDLHLQGELAASELDFDLRDEVIRAENPLRYDLQVEKLHNAILVQGQLELTLDCCCVRCLKPFQQKLTLENWTCHLPLAGEEKTAVDNDCVDLTPFVREDMLLEFPRHPLCRPDCGGLKQMKAGRRQNHGGDETLKPSAWAELDKLDLYF